jgi:putative ABC transport system permease protein
MQTGVAGVLGFFLLVVSLVLLVACANIAGVMLARVVARRREIAVRRSLGAGRARLVRQWVTESILLALLGGVAGLVVALWTQQALLTLLPPDDAFISFAPNLQLDGTILGFMFLVTFLTGVLLSLLPAARAGGTDVVTALKEEAGTSSGGSRRSRLQSVFVVGQVMVAALLLVVAGLLLRTLREAESFHPGFETENMFLASVNLRPYGYTEETGTEFYRQLTGRLRSLPGVQSVTFAAAVPLSGNVDRNRFVIPGHEPSSEQPGISLDTNIVGPGYFSTMGISILRGRDFGLQDAQPGAQPVVVINQTMARRFWSGEEPVGQQIRVGVNGPFLEIIGVVRDSKYYALAEEPMPYVYGSFSQRYMSSNVIQIRTATNPAALGETVRKEVAALDPAVAVRRIGTFVQLRQAALLPQQALASVTTVFSLLTLVLTAIGLYGVLSYSVTQRIHEIGIRMALGARRGDVLRLIAGRGLGLTVIGVGLGLAAALGVTRFLESLLFGVTATDPATFLSVAGLLMGVALLACWVPARYE